MYRTLNAHYQQRFGCKVYKLSIDAGFTCPNRDGTIGTGGCIFCSEAGSGVCRGLIASPLLRRLPEGQDGVIPVPTLGPGGTGRRGRSRGTPVGGLEKCGKMFRKSPRFSAERFSKSFATVCPRGNDNRKALRFSFPS